LPGEHRFLDSRAVDQCGRGASHYYQAMRAESPNKLSHGRYDKWNTSDVMLDWPLDGGRVDLASVFGNDRPVELEIGSGKGTFLLARAAARRDLNFLGIEWAGSYCHYAADRIRRAELGNVRMIHTDATHFVRRCLADESIWRVHIYFPDPWPKRKHHRRRSLQLGFALQLRRVLATGGQLLIVTDHMDYFTHIRRALSWVRGLMPIRFARMTDESGEITGTNFERKYIALGRAFFTGGWMKRADPA